LIVWPQKVVKKTWEGTNFSKILVDARWASEISFVGEENFNGLEIIYSSDGEYGNDIIPKFKINSEILYFTENYSPTFYQFNDKLSAHKFISSQVKIKLNSKFSLILYANDSKINGEGQIDFLEIYQRNGSCNLYNLRSKGNIKTIDADIYIYNRDIKISAKSINGKVKSSYEKVISKDSGLKIYSLNGDIIDN
tara:strand:- start:1676 stop:2257 length:582 start_codon:yes stop_codon:yes gene_type:complete